MKQFIDKFMFIRVTAVLLTFLLAACGGGSIEDDVHLTEIVIFVPDGYKSPNINDTFQLDAAGIYTNAGANETITSKATWASSNPEIATVSETGEVTTLSAGEVIIVASYSDISRGIKLTIKPPPVLESFKIDDIDSGYNIYEDEYLELTTLASFDDTSSSIDNTLYNWTSSDETVATIDENGRVFGVHYGEIQLTATAKENDEISHEITLTVKAKVEEILIEGDISYVEAGETAYVFVQEKLSDGTTHQIPPKQVRWDYDTPDIARISATGKIQISALGSVNVTATVNDFQTTHKLIIENPIELFVTGDTGNIIKLAWHEKHDASLYTLYWNNGGENEEDNVIEFKADEPLEYTHADVDTGKPYYYRLSFTRNDDELPPSRVMKVWTHKGVWQFRDFIEPRTNATGASFSEFVYLFGGIITSQIDATAPEKAVTNEVWQYNIVKNKWTKVDSLESPLKNATACASNEFIYLVGGQDKNNTAVGSIHKYNVLTGKWDFNTLTLPIPLSNASCNIQNNILYVTGGFDGAAAVATSYAYDIDSGVLDDSLPALQTARYRHSSEILDNKIYVAGGTTDANEATGQIEVLDTTASDKSWTTLPAVMDPPRTDFALHTWNNKLHAIGGINNAGELVDSITGFSIEDQLWQELTAMTVPSSAFVSTLYNNGLYLLSGSQKAQDNSGGESNFLRYGIDSGTWIHDSKLNAARNKFSAVMLDEKLYVIGGANSNGATTDFRAYDTRYNSWEDLSAALPSPRQNAAAVAYQQQSERRIYLMGGLNGSEHLKDMQIFDLKTNTWESKDSMTVPRASAAAALLDKKIYIFGGNNQDANQTFEIFDTTNNSWQILSDMPRARSHATAVALNNDIYIIGGYVDGKLNNSGYENGIATDTVDVYTPSSNQWSIAGTLGLKRIQPGSTMFNGRIYVFGGIDENGNAIASVETYTPFTRKWDEIISKLPKPGITVQGGSFENKIFVIGEVGHVADQLKNHIYVLE